MNTFQPIASSLNKVSFGFLTPDEIKALSVKRIQNPETFDSLLNPVPGGLYDQALGAWGDYSCTTCNLSPFSCPGHPGHIDLPLPVYHCVVLDQVVSLLNGMCAFCHFFRLTAAGIHKYACKLQLLQYGLVEASREIDVVVATGDEVGNSSDEDGSVEDEDRQIRVQSEFVKKAIKQAGFHHKQPPPADARAEAVLDERRNTLRSFFADIRKGGGRCQRCSGRSHKWRRDKSHKLFRRPLGSRDSKAMVDKGRTVVNPLVTALRAKKLARKETQADREADEGITMDADDALEQEEAEAEAMLEDELADAGLLDGDAEEARSKKNNILTAVADQYVNTEEVFAHLEGLFEREHKVLALVYNMNASSADSVRITPERFFIRTLLVPPNRFRPETKTAGIGITEAEQNNLYRAILKSSARLREIQLILQGKTEDATPSRHRARDFTDFQTEWVNLQDHVNALIDSNLNSTRSRSGRPVEEGIKQKFEKKEGLFRMNMMGKRVNFAARSVISPDPNIETNEIGVPPVFARKLTFAEPVTNHNFYDLKERVENGPNKWPGAAAIENESGQVISLMNKSPEERQALANQLLAPSSSRSNGSKNKKVHRHLGNGDIVIMNRQPTLHKPSMMCHRARILPGEKTIRMHYANCNTYNADFDGDEMNMHFPQTELGRAEASLIADTDHQYLVATSGKPLRGLIQDHISMGVALTNRDTLFDRSDYHQLLYGALRPESGHTSNERILTVDPAIIKPKPMWTGKQVISSILKNIVPEGLPGLNLVGKSSTDAKFWGPGSEESVVTFQSSELLTGILDKAHLGPTNGGFVHAVHELYGHTTAGQLLSILGRLLTRYLNMRAWSCGMEDIVLSKAGDQIRRSTLQGAKDIGQEVAAKYVSLDDYSGPKDPRLRERLEDVLRDDAKQLGLDNATNSRNKDLSTLVTKSCLPNGLFKAFPLNHMQTMTASGAKGSIVNANQISCNLGQQVLEGRRVPVMVSGKTLPCFKPFETNIRAGGYITNRFLSGVQPQEYYFHAMAGREGLIDTAVKTSRSGYLQRCVIKGMEGLKVEYDTSVRDSDGTIVQFLYGEDGLDVTKQKHLQDFKFLAQNFESVSVKTNISEGAPRLFDPEGIASKWNKVALKKFKKGDLTSVDPVLARFNPGNTWGSTSEAFAGGLKDYIDENPDKLIRHKSNVSTENAISKGNFEAVMNMKYLKSVVEPGEAVGIIAGQSVGEPSTQMTLNTFHLAGHAAKNVTLGIPRLKEIVMTASKQMATPTMTLHLNDEVTEEEGKKFAKGISRLSLAEIIDTVTVEEKVGPGREGERARTYEITLNFYPKEEYETTYEIKSSDVSKTLSGKFVPLLAVALKKDFKAKARSKGLSGELAIPQIGESTGRAEEHRPRAAAANAGGDEEGAAIENDGESEDEGDPENDASASKRKNQEAEAYEDDDDAQPSDSSDDDADNDSTDEGYVGSPKPSGGDDADGPSASTKVSRARGKARSNDLEAQLMTKYSALTRFSFNEERGSRCRIDFEYGLTEDKVLMLNHVETACHAALIQFIPGVKACTYATEEVQDAATKTKRAVPVVLTEGSNLLAMRGYQDQINPKKMLTNDIVGMLTYYGVEAARATVIREMSAVFEGHGIAVDNRHLNLIADTMTRDGGFKGFNRGTMASSTSPFNKMSFETTLSFLKDAVLSGDSDDLSNPSARIVVGKTNRFGTGAFDVLVRLNVDTVSNEVVERDDGSNAEMS